PSRGSGITGALGIRLDGAAPGARLQAGDALPSRSNYLIGRDPAKWRTGIPNFEKVAYRDVYPGIDLVYYGRQRQLESDLVVRPGADPARIRLAFDGAESVKPTANGDLIVHLRGGDLRLEKPTVYQGAEGARHEIASRYVVDRRGRVGVRLAPYDRTRPLVIDPVLSFSTFLGGSLGNSTANGIAVDPDGNVYVTGQTDSMDFPTYPHDRFCDIVPRFGRLYCDTNAGKTDVFVTKLVPVQSHFAYAYSTYIGGSEDDFGNAIAVDAGGNAYVTGQTFSTTDQASDDFPTTLDAFQRTPLGGSCTTGPPNPQARPCPDAFVLKVDPDGSRLVYSTFLGGEDTGPLGPGLDSGSGIALDAAGEAYVTGQTRSDTFPHTPNAFRTALAPGDCGPPSAPCPDAFVTKLDATGSDVIFSTFLGGSREDQANAIAVDVDGWAYVTGQTRSPDFPVCEVFFGIPIDRRCPHTFQTRLGGRSDAFVTKLGPDGRLGYSTYLGGDGADDGGNGIAVRSVTTIVHGFPVTTTNAYVTGFTASADFPVANAFQAVYGGYEDAFVAELDPHGDGLVYSTFLGGSNGFGNPPTEAGNAIAVDAAGNAYVTGYTRATTNASAPDGLPFPTVRPLQASCAACLDGGTGAFLAKLDPGGALRYSTYLGGSGLNDNISRAIALDGSGGVWVAGSTESTDFPVVDPLHGGPSGGTSDAFVSRIVDSSGGVADLAVGQTASPEPAVEGADLTYAAIVVNNGPDAAANVALIESLAPEVTFASASASQGGCAPALGKKVICNLGDLAPGAATTVTLVVTPNRKGP
ncbi:MAG: hypothetical protein DMF78_22675, partial [Acidobacteria bacterium]